MKIIKIEEPEFKPVTIMFESQNEVDLVTTLIGACPSSVEKLFTDVDTYDMYDKLYLLSKDRKCSFITISVEK